MRTLTIILTLMPFLVSGQFTERTNPAWTSETVSFRAAMKAAKMPLTYEQLNAFDNYIRRGIPYPDTLRGGKVATNFRVDSLNTQNMKWADTGYLISTKANVTNLITYEFTSRMMLSSASLNFPSTQGQRSSDMVMSVPGAHAGDMVVVGAGTWPANTCFSAFVSSLDAVTIRFNNYSATSVDPVTQTFFIAIFKTTLP